MCTPRCSSVTRSTSTRFASASAATTLDARHPHASCLTASKAISLRHFGQRIASPPHQHRHNPQQRDPPPMHGFRTSRKPCAGRKGGDGENKRMGPVGRTGAGGPGQAGWAPWPARTSSTRTSSTGLEHLVNVASTSGSVVRVHRRVYRWVFSLTHQSSPLY